MWVDECSKWPCKTNKFRMACKRNKIQQMTKISTMFELSSYQCRIFWLSRNSKWDGTRIIFNLKSLYNVYVFLYVRMYAICYECLWLFVQKYQILLLENDLENVPYTVKRFIWNTFNAIFLHFYFATEYSRFFFISFSKGHFELTNKPYIKTSYVSFYLKRFPLEIVLRSWWFFPFCTLFHYFCFSFSIFFETATHTILIKLFHFILFSFSLTPTALHYISNARKMYNIWW